ncbi:MAG: cation:proton antiporter [Rhodospirillales bacterium]|nr:cation:proton antiporter [Rhodospirillales bacterium]
MEHASSVVDLVGLIVALLLIAGAVRAITKRVKLPFTVALVLAGLALRQLAEHGPKFLETFAAYEVSPDVILFVFLPAIIFESAFNMDVRQLKQNLLPTLALAVPGLMISTGIIGTIVWWATPFDLPAALLLGAILSATDPVAVIALFKNLGVPQRLTILVEGESLFNDATAIVAARILVGVAAGGYVLSAQTALSSTVDFFFVFLGGAFVGWIAAVIFGWVLGRVEGDTFIETSLTTILAYLSFVLAEHTFHVSGVMATVAAGLTMGSWGRAKISASVAGYIEHFWEYMSNLANALIFLLVGLRVDLGALYESLDILPWVILAMLVSRATVVFGLVPLVGRLPGAVPVGLPYRAVMYWGGLRGAIALAIVLSLDNFAHSEIFVALVMGSVLFTLLVQALSIETLVHRLGLDKPPLVDQVGAAEGLLAAKHRALERLPEIQEGGMFSYRIANDLEEVLTAEVRVLRGELEELRHRELASEDERILIYSRVFAAERTIYYELFTKGHISERVYRDLCHAVGHESDAIRHGLALSRDPLHLQDDQRISVAWYKFFDGALGFTGIPERMRLAHVAREYEEAWARYQVCTRILKDLESLVFAESARPGIVAEVRKRYRLWLTAAQGHIDSTAEQFPEFVTTMQERLARRLLVIAEKDIIEAESRAGSIPPGVRDKVMERLESEIRRSRGGEIAHLRLDATEILRQVPFFQGTDKEEFSRVASMLRQRTIPANKSIIRQGEKGETLYLIARGVVRVTRNHNGDSQDLATLIAGDFFGEMALLHHEPRMATCRAVTPTAVYELRRKDFDKACQTCPGLQEALEEADKARKQELAAK